MSDRWIDKRGKQDNWYQLTTTINDMANATNYTTASMNQLTNVWQTTNATTYVDVTSNGTSMDTITIDIPPGTSSIKIPVPYNPPAPPRRRPPSLDFNPFINASDRLEEFIAFAGENKVRRGEVLKLPVELFLKWLIIQACEADDEEPNVTLDMATARPAQPRCLGCQRFMTRNVVVPLHDDRCAQRYFARGVAA